MRRQSLLLMLLLLDASAARAEEPASRPARSEEKQKAAAAEYVTVVKARRPKKPAGVERIDRDEIVSSGAHSAAELLEGASSVHAASGSRGERILTLRGFSQRQLAVLVDGAPSYVPYDGQVDLGMFPVELIDRITLIKGPGSILYGPNGLGGALNIVTRRPGSGPTAEVLAETGRSGFLRLRGYHALEVNDRLAYAVHGGLSRQDDFALSARFDPAPGEAGGRRDNSDRESYNLGARVWLSPAARHQLEAGLSFVDGSRGVPGSAAEREPRYWRFTTWRALNLTLSHAGRYLGALEVDEQLYLSLFDNLLDGYDDATFSTQRSPAAFRSWYHDRIFGGRVRARYRAEKTPWGPTELRLWASLQHDWHERDDGVAAARSERTIVTLAPEVEASFRRWLKLTLALQLDAENPTGSAEPAVALGPLLSLRLDPTRRLSLQATAARRTRFPTLKERYSSAGGYREPNPDLNPEVAWNLGLELSYRPARWLALRAAAFDAEVTDLIERVYLGGGRDRLDNIGAARLLGGELSLRLDPLRWLRLRAGYSLLHARRTDEGRDTDLLQYRPAHKAAFRLRLAPRRWLQLSTSLIVVGPQRFEHPETGAWGRLGAYARWDARLSVSPARWATIWVSAKNLLDADYQTKLGYPDPGRQLFVGMRLTYER